MGSVPIYQSIGRCPPPFAGFDYVECTDFDAMKRLLSEGWNLWQQVTMRGPGWFDYWTKYRLWRKPVGGSSGK